MSRRTRVRRHRSSKKNSRVLRLLGGSVALAVVFSLIATGTGVALAFGTATSWLEDLPDISDPNAFAVAQTTKIYSADGVLLANLYLENREVVPLDQISPHLLHAVVAVEDERFYEHNGVDYVGIVRAFVTRLTTGRLEGGSTLTQQYIRNTVLADERFDITYRRKLREAWLALELERRYSKDEILAMYLNTVYFGEGAYGAEAASLTFFNKHASELTIAEAALLAGLPQAPSALTPYDNPEGAVGRRQWVLSKMFEQGYVTSAEYEAAKVEELRLERSQQLEEQGVYAAPYFVAHVKKVLQDEYGTSLVFQGGLTVYTTLDTKMQTLAEKAVRGILNKSNDPDAALVAIDPKTGYVKTLVGGRDWQKNKFNFATQAHRQCGSSFKMFTLVTSIEAGMPPTKRKVSGSSPATIKTGGEPWIVHNCEGAGTRGYITIEQATINSVNCAYGRLIKELGADKVAEVANRMGIQTKIRPYLSITLGTEGVTPLEMASAFGTLAANGMHYDPIAVTKIVDSSGKTIFEAKPEGVQALSHEVAYATTQVLQKVVSSGTATNARIGRPQAGKTGTTQDYRDAWFIGYTPDIVASVWIGYTPERPMTNVHGRTQYGGTFPAMIWHDFMIKALKDVPKSDFAPAKAPKYAWEDTWDVPGVPNVVGMTQDEAIKTLKDDGYTKVKIASAYSEDVGAGLIASQSPKGGSTADKDTTVKIVISLGPPPISPPTTGTPSPPPHTP